MGICWRTRSAVHRGVADSSKERDTSFGGKLLSAACGRTSDGVLQAVSANMFSCNQRCINMNSFLNCSRGFWDR